jgi:hypothetical protein
MRTLYLYIFIILAFAACQKSELEQVPNNDPPTDNTISSVTIDNYITRTYILTLGREPSDAEFNSAHTILSGTGLDSTSRQTFLTSVFNSSDYLPHVYNENRIDLLNNTDTAEFTFWINVLQLFLSDTSYQLQWPYYQYEIDRLVDLRNAFPLFISDSIDVPELQRRMCNNYLYDQINMGSANFVISSFQHLLNRNPTNAEQTSGISMVDGNNAILFLVSGNSKNDYLNIITSNSNYFEAQVVFLYLKFLNRNPTTLEMSAGTQKYSTTGDYTAVQRDILSSDEFIGL